MTAAYACYIPRMGRKPGPMLDDYDALIAAGDVHVLADGGVVVGLVVLKASPASMLLDNVAVDPSLRGQGFGRVLLRHAETAALAAGYDRLDLYTHETMTENIALYARNGFVETHRAEDKGFRRVYMSKRLDRRADG